MMDQSALDRLLEQRRKKSVPALPGAFSQNVWREIRLRKAESESSVNPVSFWSWLFQRQHVLAVLLGAMLVGVGIGSRSSVSPASQTHEALDLQVFGGNSEALPSTLLAHL
ncbi:MAG: hypothetical protein V4710_12465 [Verrucomicrobiota bacterium]